LRYWDAESGRELQSFPNQPGGVWAVALSRDGKRGLSSAGMTQQGADWIKGKDFSISLWDLEAGKVIRKLEGHTSEVRGVAFSPDERHALSCGWDMIVRLWDLETGKELKQFKGHTASVRSVAFSRDGKRAVSASKDKTVRVWDLETGKEVGHFKGHAEDVFSATFTPDGRRVLSAGADAMIRLWEVETGKEVRRYGGHTTVIWSIALSPDGRRLLSVAGTQPRGDGFYEPAGKDSAVRLWDVDSGLELFRFAGHTSSVMGVVFAPDGRQALSSGSDGTIRLWKVGLGGKE
jgi:WD40 repeat protein